MDALDRLLERAHAEGAWKPEGLAAFAEGLRERARLVLDERIAPLEGRIRALETSVASLERENAWRREAMEGLERENAWRREAMKGLEVEAQALRAGWDSAAASHGALLAHHRDVVSRAVQRFASAATLPVWRFRTCRTLLADSAALLARELP